MAGNSFVGRGTLELFISNANASPIYEQIAQQIKSAILQGELVEGAILPSIRSLANDLHVSVITTKRTYAELEASGLVTTVQGKGTFVAGGNFELLKEERLRSIEEQLARAIEEARGAGITRADLHDMIDLLMEDR